MSSTDVPADGPVWAIVLAAGSGRRYGPHPKQYEFLGSERVVDRSLAIARAAADHVVVVLGPGEEAEGARLVESGAADVAVEGGEAAEERGAVRDRDVRHHVQRYHRSTRARQRKTVSPMTSVEPPIRAARRRHSARGQMCAGITI